jgi:hypothetical protein
MKPRVIAYVADSSNFNGWLAQLASLSEGYNFIAISGRDKILDYLTNKPLTLLVVQLDRQDSFLAPVLAFVQSTMPDLPIIGFVINDEDALLQGHPGLNFYFIGKIASAHQMYAEVKRAFQKIGDGGNLQSISPGVLLQIIETEKKTCTVRLFDPEQLKSGVLFFVKGNLFDARLFKSRGLPSAFEILNWVKPQVWIENRCSISAKNIRAGNKAVLLNAFQQKNPMQTADGFHLNEADLVDKASKPPRADRSPQPAALPASKDMTPSQSQVAPDAVKRVAAALSLDRRHHLESDAVYSHPALASLIKRLSLAGSILNAGRLQCGFSASLNGLNGYFVCLDEAVGVRARDGLRSESILQALFQLK